MQWPQVGENITTRRILPVSPLNAFLKSTRLSGSGLKPVLVLSWALACEAHDRAPTRISAVIRRIRFVICIDPFSGGGLKPRSSRAGRVHYDIDLAYEFTSEIWQSGISILNLLAGIRQLSDIAARNL